MLHVNNVSKVFSIAGKQLHVLDAINFGVNRGETIAIVGPSGSGKTTLLGICAGLDTPSDGDVSLADVKLNALDEDDRREHGDVQYRERGPDQRPATDRPARARRDLHVGLRRFSVRRVFAPRLPRPSIRQ